MRGTEHPFLVALPAIGSLVGQHAVDCIWKALDKDVRAEEGGTLHHFPLISSLAWSKDPQMLLARC